MMATSVFCSVYSKDPNRQQLIYEHFDCLKMQEDVERVVYVLDSGDRLAIPEGADSIVTSFSTSIYQAWNLALSSITSEFVLNLNLDDRLYPDAIHHLQRVLYSRPEAYLVGGDWRVVNSTDSWREIPFCYDAGELALSEGWPLSSLQMHTRLGTAGVSSGERGTMGPAVMWRMSAHSKIPRYPFRFGNGEIIKGIADSVFWALCQSNGLLAVRMPLVIGDYYSSPDTQAEFRAPVDEAARLEEYGVSLI